MKPFLSALILWLAIAACKREPTEYELEIDSYWAQLNNEFRDPHQSPLEPADRETFVELARYPTDEDFKVTAHLKPTPGERKLVMATSDYDRKYYREYGKLLFVLKGDTFSLSAFRNAGMPLIPTQGSKVFVPFTDKTNGKGTYMGGRYLDIEITSDTVKTVVVDFNKAYNPYCVYNANYSCPIPPLENHLDVEIKAGAKLPEAY